MLTPPLYLQEKNILKLDCCQNNLQSIMLLLFQKYEEKEILLEDIYINLNKIISKQKFIISSVIGVRLGQKKIINKTFTYTSNEEQEVEKEEVENKEKSSKYKNQEEKDSVEQEEDNEEQEIKEEKKINKKKEFDKKLVKQVHMQDAYYLNNLKEDEVTCMAGMFNEEIMLKKKYKYSINNNSYEQTYNYYLSLKKNKSYNTYMLNILNFMLGRRYSALMKMRKNNQVKKNNVRKGIYKEIQNNLFSTNKYSTRIKLASNFFIKTLKYYKFIVNNGFNFLFNKSFNRSYIRNISNKLYEQLITSSDFASNNGLFATFLQALNKDTFIRKKLTLAYSRVRKEKYGSMEREKDNQVNFKC